MSVDKHMIVSDYVAEAILKRVDPEFKEMFTNYIACCPVLAPDLVPGATKGEVVEAMKLECTFDFALPQGWFDHFHDTMGINPLPYYVWNCDKHGPVPLGETAAKLLDAYEHIIGKDV